MPGGTLLDVAEHLLDGLIPGPRTERGYLRLSLGVSVAAIGVELCVFVLVGNPVRGPDWSFGVMVGSILCASAFVLSAVSLIRHREHRRLAAFAGTVGAAAFLCPLALMW